MSSDARTNVVNTALGALASTLSIALMIPLDTVKVRMTTQAMLPAHFVRYTGVADCLARVCREEGVLALYRGLPPRLLSVVPMVAIQFTLLEIVKRRLRARNARAAGAS